MSKQTKTAAEPEAMIMSEMLDLAECPYGMSATVKRLGDSWEALTHSPDHIAYADLRCESDADRGEAENAIRSG
jgi:hypothetical protein